MLTEAAVQAKCREIATTLGAFLGRNNSGAYSAKNPPTPGTRWGWCNDSAKFNAQYKTPDLIGWATVTITPEMVGRNVAVFLGAEVKDPQWHLTPGDKRAQAQLNCINHINAAGGIAGFVTDPSQLQQMIGDWKNGK